MRSDERYGYKMDIWRIAGKYYKPRQDLAEAEHRLKVEIEDNNQSKIRTVREDRSTKVM
jgi:hypothetical protein